LHFPRLGYAVARPAMTAAAAVVEADGDILVR
jgi:hypothetical protein